MPNKVKQVTYDDLEYFWNEHGIGIAEIGSLPGYEHFEIVDKIDDDLDDYQDYVEEIGDDTGDDFVDDSYDQYNNEGETMNYFDHPSVSTDPWIKIPVPKLNLQKNIEP